MGHVCYVLTMRTHPEADASSHQIVSEAASVGKHPLPRGGIAAKPSSELSLSQTKAGP